LRGHTDEVQSVAFSGDGAQLVSGSADQTVRLWDVATGRALRTFQGHTEAVQAVAFSADGRRLASGSWDKTVRLWNVTTGQEARRLQVNTHLPISAVAFSPDGKILASGSAVLNLWNVATGQALHTLSADPQAQPTWQSVAFSPNGQWLVSGDSDKMVRLWDTTTGQLQQTFTGRIDPTHSVAFSPNGRMLARGGDNVDTLWDLAAGHLVRSLASLRVFSEVAFSRDSTTLLSSGHGHVDILLWDVATGRVRQRLAEKARETPVRDAAGRVTSTRYGDQRVVDAAALSVNGKWLASGSRDNTVQLWDVTTGQPLLLLSGHTEGVFAVAFSPDGTVLASGSHDHTIRLWAIPGGALLRTLTGHPDEVDAVAFSPDGTMLASSGGEQVRLWTAATGQVLRTLAGRGHVAFSPDGRRLVSQGHDNRNHLWDVATGRPLWTSSPYDDGISWFAFSANGRVLAGSCGDATIRLWEAETGKELASLVALNDQDWLIVTPDGLFDGSPAAWSQILWRFSPQLFDVAPVEIFFNEYYSPGLLAELFAGKRPQATQNILQKDRRQPHVRLALMNGPTTTALTARRVQVKVDITDAPAGAQDVRLFRNGALVKVWRGDVLKGQTHVTLDANMALSAGANRLTAYAFNRDNIKSPDAVLTISGADSLRRQGTAYLLAIGINQYANAQFNLRYAVADAEDFAAEFRQQQVALKHYERVEVIPLHDQRATKANILRALTELAARVQPEDAVIIFYAGHGTAEQQQFYLIPHDLGYNGERGRIDGAGLQAILTHGISDRELEHVFEAVDAGHLLLVIDACNSGQVLEADERRRGPMNSKGLAQLAYEKGMYILTAAQSYQAAQELSELQHGLLTYALVEEGLRRRSADTAPQDGTVLLREWLNYATDRVPQLQMDRMRQASQRGRGLAYVEGEERLAEVEQRNVQRPRVFYRRELEAQPFVIAR